MTGAGAKGSVTGATTDGHTTQHQKEVRTIAWFKVDDGLHASRKFLSIPRRNRFAAIGVWTVAGAWSADQLTNGHVPQYMLTEWGVPPSAAECLVDAGLWKVERDGFVFRNWLEYQPSKQDVDAERAASRERMRELRARRKQPKPQKDAEEEVVFGRTGPNGSENVRNPDPTRPDPTRPDPPKKEEHSRIDDAFESAYKVWPKKVEKKKSLAKFRLLAKKMPVDELTGHIIRFGKAYHDTTDRQYVPSLVAWLNGERWNDDPPTASNDVIDAQWAAAMAGVKPDPCANGHKWAADNSCIRCPVIREAGER